MEPIQLRQIEVVVKCLVGVTKVVHRVLPRDESPMLYEAGLLDRSKSFREFAVGERMP